MENDTCREALQEDIRRVKRVGLSLILVTFVGFGGWAAVAPLSSAAIAPGQISPDGSQRVVQHLEGGIVAQLPVKEGDTVKKGQLLVVLDKSLASANHLAKLKKMRRLEITLARLEASQTSDDVLPTTLVNRVNASRDKKLMRFLANQQAILGLSRKMFAERTDLFVAQEGQAAAEVAGLKAQIVGIKDQRKLIETEIRSKEKLVRQGLIKLPELYALQRKSVELRSQSKSLESTVLRVQQKLNEIRIAKLNLKTEIMEKISTEISQVSRDLAQAREGFNATSDILKRTIINSPIDGKILNLNVKTIGGVVRPGEPIATIVPSNDELIVDARLSPTDIDNVNLGMTATVQINSFMARHMLPLNGEVIQVGADVLSDPDSKQKYYPLKVRVAATALNDVSEKVSLQAGMPADVFVQTGVHTPWRYIFDPVRKSFDRAFREEAMQ